MRDKVLEMLDEEIGREQVAFWNAEKRLAALFLDPSDSGEKRAEFQALSNEAQSRHGRLNALADFRTRVLGEL